MFFIEVWALSKQQDRCRCENFSISWIAVSIVIGVLCEGTSAVHINKNKFIGGAKAVVLFTQPSVRQSNHRIFEASCHLDVRPCLLH